MQLVKTSFVGIFLVFLMSCLGPVKELQYQIEDSLEDTTLNIDNPSPLKEISNSIELNILSNFSIDGDLPLNLKPTILNDDKFILVASFDGLVYLLGQNDLAIKMKYQHELNIIAGLAYQGGKIFFVDSKGYLCAISNNGLLEWKVFVGEVYSPPKITEKLVIVRTTNNKFVASSLIDGSEIWKYQAISPQLNIRSWGQINSDDSALFAGINSGKIIAINLDDGSLIWERTFSPPSGSSEIERANDVTSEPIVGNSIIYTISSKGKIAAISKTEGVILWDRSLSSFDGLLDNENNIFVSHNSGSVYSLFKETGKVLWRNADLLGRDVKRGAIFKDKIMVTDYEGYIHFININTGNIVAREKFSDSQISTIIPINNSSIFYVFYRNGDIFKINVGDENISNNIQSSVKKYQDSDDIDFEESDKKNINEEETLLDNLIFWD